MNINKMEISDKVNHRTHHTRFFEKLYGNLESSNDKKDGRVELVRCNESSMNLQSEVKRPENLNSPSDSSGSSSEIFTNDPSATRNSMFAPNNEIGLQGFPAILPPHFGSLRLPLGFSNDPHNHFAAFLARRRRKEGRQRRQRTTFSSDQTLRLEVEFNRNEYISRGRRFELAESLHLSETQIKIWNRRAKDKRIEKAQIDQQYRNFAAASGLIPFSIGYSQPPFISSTISGPSSNYSNVTAESKFNQKKIESTS